MLLTFFEVFTSPNMWRWMYESKARFRRVFKGLQLIFLGFVVWNKPFSLDVDMSVDLMVNECVLL